MARLRVIQMRRHTKIFYPLVFGRALETHGDDIAMYVRRERTNTDREGDTGDGRAATGSRGAVDDCYDHDDHDDVRTGRIGDRNETDCDGAVVALLVSNARICVRCACARARCGGDGDDGGGCARAYVCGPAAAE